MPRIAQSKKHNLLRERHVLDVFAAHDPEVKDALTGATHRLAEAVEKKQKPTPPIERE